MVCMKSRIYTAAVLMLLLAGGAGAANPEQHISWAKSWDDAVTEAQALNVPIVVHRHGFY